MPSKFERRQYDVIAGIFSVQYLKARQQNDLFAIGLLDDLISQLNAYFQADNARFQPGRFEAAAKGTRA